MENKSSSGVGQVEPSSVIPPAAKWDRAAAYEFTKDYITPYIGQWTAHLGQFKGKPDVHFLEVGTFEGCTTLWMLDNILTGAGCSITCIDIFESPAYEARFDHNVAVSGHAAKVTKLSGRSQELLPSLSGRKFDAIYIDGGHTAAEVYTDASLCWPLLKPGGVVSFDDYEWRMYRPPENRPQQGIDKFLAEHADELVILHKSYTVLARRKE
jgi:predicted O-methyltransferase YrrM